MVKEFGLYTDIVVTPVAEVEEVRCPACGRQPWIETPIPAWRSGRYPWRPWVFLVVAAYLGLVFGPLAWGDYRAVVNGREWLRGTEGLSAGVVVDPFRYVIRNVKASATAWETYVLASERMDRDLGALWVGGVAAFLGLGSALRGTRSPATVGSLPSRRHATPWTNNRLTTAVVAGLTLGEAVGLSLFRLLLVVFCYVAVSGLTEGERSPGLLAINTASRTLDVLAGVVRLLP